MKTKNTLFSSLLIVFLFFHTHTCSAIMVSTANAKAIAKKIWHNECGGTINGLTFWNEGEKFPSLGIGHFIWYPEGEKEHFKETFPNLLIFLNNAGAKVPEWLLKVKGCPWKTRSEFYKDINSLKMNQLREMLATTTDLQARFIVNKMETLLTDLTSKLTIQEANKVTMNFQALSKTQEGLYAIIDYHNFKGAGNSPAEAYNNKRWGLLQVLLKMEYHKEQPIKAFVIAAKQILHERVQNAPKERNESRWLPGWFNRLDTYLAD